jgi:hypothetical protein
VASHATNSTTITAAAAMTMMAIVLIEPSSYL